MLKRIRGPKEEEQPTKKSHLKYPRPKILLIDLPTSCIDSVRSAGFNASTGTFGSPYEVERGDGYLPVIGKASLPNYTEQEIVLVDLTPPETIVGPEREKATSSGEHDWWAKTSRGEIDPRPRFMAMVQGDFDRILKHGGLFVIFAQPLLSQELSWARVVYGNLKFDAKIPADNWSFLSLLHNVQIESDFGEEILVPNYDDQVFHFLRKHAKEAEYAATLRPSYAIRDTWIPILFNKFHECIGGLITPKESKGRILILPQLSNKPEAILALLREVLPGISPHLFPHIEGSRWVERDEYELESVLKLKTERTEVQQRAKKELAEVDKKISQERDKLGFLHGMITCTGEELVVCVQSCLRLIGFEQITDVDKQIRKQDPSAPKQEDLQIHDKSPVLLLEIKGLSGLPHETDTIQVVKYVPRRMKEWGRVDVRGVSIINHQRHVPALERGNQNVFTEQQVEDAVNHDITLLTTWDLFLLATGMLKWGWDPEAIRELLYQSGRMPRLPSIYKPTGRIVKYWEKPGVVTVEISDNTLHKGERIGYIIPEGYLEEEVLSLQVEKQDVEGVVPGQLAGVKTIYPRELLRKGTLVCKVLKHE
jgi:hypothetical protein